MTTHPASQRPRLAYTLEQVSQILQEPVATTAKHCRTQPLKGAYKAGGGRTSPWRVPPAAINYCQRSQPQQ